jgi:hypothetical protein
VPAMTRRGHPPDTRAIARLRRWYAWSIAGRWSDRALIHAWTLRVPPNVWNLGWPPTEAEVAAYPGRYLIHTDGTAWGPHELVLARADLAARLTDGPRFIPDDIGSGAFFFGPPIGELVRCAWAFVAYRATERHHLGPRADDSADEALSRLVYAMGIASLGHDSAHVGRKKGVSPVTGRRYRRSASTSRVARALLVWGLIEAGLNHRAAIRLWLDWEIALGGPLAASPTVRAAWELLAHDVDRDPWLPIVRGDDRDLFREFEESQRGANRQVWAEMGIAR